MHYTPRIDGFQICDPTYLGQPPQDTPPTFDVVKWVQTEPREVWCYDMETGELSRETSTEYCYVVAMLIWDAHEPCFDFHSVGMRWLEAEPTRAAIDMIREFAEKKGEELDV